MKSVQDNLTCKIYLHPMTCCRPSSLAAFQLRTGLQIIATPKGNAQAIPQLGGVA